MIKFMLRFINIKLIMIPVQIDLKMIDDILLFGNGRSNKLNYEPLDQYEAGRLLELVQRLSSIYLSNSNSPIGGNWGLLGFGFQSRNGIIIYNEFQKMKKEGYVSGLGQLPEVFLAQLDILEPNSKQFYSRCELLCLDPAEVITIGKNAGKVNIPFQLNERIFAEDQYLSDPGSQASDILDSFTYEEVEVISVWRSERSLEEDQIRDIPEIPKNLRMSKRPVQSKFMMEIEDESNTTKKINRKTKAKRPSRKRQRKLILQLVNSTKKKLHNIKLKKVSNRQNRSKGRTHRQSKHRYPIRHLNINSEDESSGNRGRQPKLTRLRTKVPTVNLNDYERESNTFENESYYMNRDLDHQMTVRPRKAANKLTITRIDLTNLVYHDDYPVNISKGYLYIQQEMKRLTNPTKVLKILKHTVTTYLKQVEPITKFNILYLKLVCDCYVLLSNQRELLSDFIKYFIEVEFSKLIGIVTLYLIDQEYEDKDSMGIILQEFQGLMIISQQEQFKKVIESISLPHLIDQFLEDCFQQSSIRSKQISYFPAKSLKLIFNALLGYTNTVQALVSCRLAEKVFYSKAIFKRESTSTDPSTTSIPSYKKYISKLTPQQLDNILPLIIDIERTYPSFWTFQEFSSLISLIDYQRRQFTPHIQSYLKQIVNIYVRQQLSITPNQYKHLLNQILKQTFLGNTKYKEGISYWHLIYMTIVREMLEFRIFQNSFVYKQIFMEVDSIKLTESNFKMISQFVIKAFLSSVLSQRIPFEKQFETTHNAVLNSYRELSKLKTIYVEKIEEQERHLEFKASRKTEENITSHIENMYNSLYSHSDTPEMLPLKLKMLFQDQKLVEILTKSNPIWREIKQGLVTVVYAFLIKPTISFQVYNPDPTQPQNQNSDSDDKQIQKLMIKQAKYNNYHLYILGLITQQFKSVQRSILNLPLGLDIKHKELILSQFRLHGCRLALKVIVDRTISQEIIRFCQYIQANKYQQFYTQCGGNSLLFSYEFLSGVLETLMGWYSYKRIQLNEVFLQEISCLVLNMSLYDSLSLQRDKLLHLQIQTLNIQFSKLSFWMQFLCEYQSVPNSSSPIQSYIESIIKVDSQSVFLDYYFKKYEREIEKVKIAQLKSLKSCLYLLDLIMVILNIKREGYPSRMNLLFDILFPDSSRSNQQFFHKQWINNRQVISKLSKLLTLLISRSKTNACLQQLATQQVRYILFWEVDSINLAENKHQIVGECYLVKYIDVCEESYQSNKMEHSQSEYEAMLKLILDELYASDLIKKQMSSIICDMVLNELIKKSRVFKKYLEEYRVQKIAQKYISS